MRTNSLAACVAGLAIAGCCATAGAQTASRVKTASIHLDPARTEITFSAGSIRRIHGTFQLKGGIFAVDTSTGVAQGEILADAASEKSNSESMDRKLQSRTLESDKYPGIFFHPEKVTGSLPKTDGESHLQLIGSLNIHGADHPLTVDLDAVRKGQELLLKTAFTVPYVKWGMKDASTFLMRDRNIRITVVSHGILEAPHA